MGKHQVARGVETRSQIVRRAQLKYLYGLTVEEYDNMVERQGGGCAICHRGPSKGTARLYVDHDHDTDKVRGLLCQQCNSALGLLQDDPTIVYNAYTYLLED